MTLRVGLTEIIASGLEAAASEMCASLIRTAYSPNIKERGDCSAAICDVAGHTIALATNAPAHLGSTLILVPAILERFPLETLRSGDVFFANDPYIAGVTHLNDCTVCAPVFLDGRVIGFTAAVAHHSDVGGRVPGSESGDSTSIYQEGIRFPPVKLVEAGERRRDVWETFLLNSRTPHFSDGDLYAQIAANTRGAERLQALFRRYPGEMEKALIEMRDATERRARAAIRSGLRPGRYHAVDWLDENGVDDEPVRLAVTLTVSQSGLEFDFSDCGPQLPTGKNVPYTHLMATIYFCVKATLDPNLPVNEGLYRVVRVIAPEGSVVNPRPPAGVSARNHTSMILADAILSVFGQASPERAMAAGGPCQGIILSGQDPIRRRYFVDYENFAGGQGGSTVRDGPDVVQLHMTNTSNLPIEVMENEFPVRVERYEMIPDSGGAGRYRGGLGVRRELRIVAPGVRLATRCARQKFAAQGLAGGEAGGLGAYTVNPGTPTERRLRPTVSEFLLDEDDLLCITTPGGGGFGDPHERERELVHRDLLDGKITIAAARARYGYEPVAGERMAEDMLPQGRASQAPAINPSIMPTASPGKSSASTNAARSSPRVVVTAESLAPEAVKLLTDRGARVRYLPGSSSMEALKDAIAEAPTDAIISRAMPLTAEVMDAAGALKVISKYGVGVDNIDLRAAAERGVVVMRAYGTNARSVAELALTMMLLLLKRVFALDASLRAGRWEKYSTPGIELTGKHLGIVGCGAVGGDLAALSRSFAMPLTIYDPYIEAASVPLGAERVDRLEALLERADVVSLHCPLTAETRGMIGAAELDRMKATALLVNAARGPVVDESALIAALQTGRIAGAGLDAFTQEPPDPGSPLWHLPNVVVTPHIGGSTREAMTRVAVQAVKNVFTILEGETPDPRFVVTQWKF
ncbi:MAG TPA: hydantoinase B/oxoprolinase family protein [Casimicrobiaceae bacterium]